MPDYKNMYLDLFNKITDAIALLQEAQLAGERAFVESDETPVRMQPPGGAGAGAQEGTDSFQ